MNGILDEMESKLKKRRFIDPKRIEACATKVIRNFLVSYSPIFNEALPSFIFGADETMIQSQSQLKVLIPSQTTNHFLLILFKNSGSWWMI